MSLAQGFPNTFSATQQTQEVLKNTDNETKKIYTDINALMAVGGHAHTGNGSDGGILNFFSNSGGTLTGVLNEALGAPIASASTINLTTATGNFLHVTGTTTITAVTLGAGMRREIIFDGILTLTHHVTNNNLPSGANITTAVGDRASYYSDGTTVYCTGYVKTDGTAVTASTDTSIQGSFKNLKIQVTSNTQATITADQIVLFDSLGSAKLIYAVSATLDKTILGAVNGLDMGTIANSTWYYVWAIAKADGTKGVLMSLSSTSPTMPTGYTFKARIGTTRTHSDGTLIRTLQKNNTAIYVVTPSSNTLNLPLMASGSTSSAYVAVSVGNFVPITANKIILMGLLSNNALWVAPNNNYATYTSTTNPPPVVINTTAYGSELASLMIESSNIYWASVIATAYLFCYGWEDNI